jgi:hypothetical protein
VGKSFCAIAGRIKWIIASDFHSERSVLRPIPEYQLRDQVAKPRQSGRGGNQTTIRSSSNRDRESKFLIGLACSRKGFHRVIGDNWQYRTSESYSSTSASSVVDKIKPSDGSIGE